MNEFTLELKALERASKLHWFHWLVVIFSLFLTLGAWTIAQTSIEEKAVLQFDREAQRAVELIQERMQKYEDGLWGGVAAIDALGGDISYPQWLTFSKSLHIDTKYPGINGIGVIYHVPTTSFGTFLHNQRKLRPDFKVHPEHHRPLYLPITYIEPIETNTQALGLDMAHETNRYQAAMKARDTGAARITGPIILVQDKAQTPGFLFYAPFYHGKKPQTLAEREARFAGMVYAPFVVKKLMEGTLHKEKRDVRISITDDGSMLYNEHSQEIFGFDPKPLFTKTLELDLYGRTWVFDIRSAKSFRAIAHNNQPLFILIGGILLDAMLLTLFILLANTNRRAYTLVRQVVGL